jgi:hypothetical protein
MSRLIVITLCLHCFSSNAQYLPDYVGSQAAAMGGVSTLLPSVWSATNNPGALGNLKNSEVAVNHQQLFGLKDLAYSSFSGAYKHKTGVWGVFANRWGYEWYQYNQIGAAYGKSLTQTWSAGVNFSYNQLSFGDNYYGKASNIRVGFGSLAKLSNKLSIGVYIQNLHRPNVLSDGSERDEPSFTVGMGYKASSNTYLALEAFQQINQPLSIRMGMEFTHNEKYFFRTGISTQPFSGAFGFGMAFKKFRLNFAATYHNVLGFSPQSGLHYVAE